MNTITTLGLALGFACALAGSAAAQVKFGVGGPITGPNAATGAQMKNGVEQAADDINAAGGILGQKLQPSTLATTFPIPSKASRSPTSSSADGVKFVIGHYNSGVTIPASEVYQENGILEITPASTNPTVTERGMWNIFRTCGRDDQQGTGRRHLYPRALQGQEDRLRQRQDHLRQGPRRRDAEDDQGRRHEGGAQRGHQHRREGLSRRWSPRSNSRAPTSSISAASTPKRD